jgi:hypothetical protein
MMGMIVPDWEGFVWGLCRVVGWVGLSGVVRGVRGENHDDLSLDDAGISSGICVLWEGGPEQKRQVEGGRFTPAGLGLRMLG